MENLLNWGIEVIVCFQQLSPTLDLPFQIFTFLGDELFYLLFLPVIIWCFDYRIGIRLTILFLFSAYLNSSAKALAGQPRPFEFDPRVKKLVQAGGYGLPSGHTQSTVVVWGFIAARFRNRSTWLIATLLIILVPLSRVYLGVHFPTDLLGGYLLGIIILFVFLNIETHAVQWLKKRSLVSQLGLSGILPILMMLVYPGDVMESIPTSATLMGGCIGLTFAHKWIRFEAGGVWWKRLLRYLLGMVIISLFYFGLKVVFADLEPASVYRFVRYALVGFAIIFLMPLIFNKIKLATSEAG